MRSELSHDHENLILFEEDKDDPDVNKKRKLERKILIDLNDIPRLACSPKSKLSLESAETEAHTLDRERTSGSKEPELIFPNHNKSFIGSTMCTLLSLMVVAKNKYEKYNGTS